MTVIRSRDFSLSRVLIMAEDGKSSPPLFGDDDEDVAQSPEPEESVPIDTDTQKEEKGLFDDDDDAENGETKRDDTPPEKEPETTQAPLSSVSDEPKVSAGDDDSTAEADEPVRKRFFAAKSRLTSHPPRPLSQAKDEDEDDLDDEYTIEVSVSDPQKVGKTSFVNEKREGYRLRHAVTTPRFFIRRWNECLYDVSSENADQHAAIQES